MRCGVDVERSHLLKVSQTSQQQPGVLLVKAILWGRLRGRESEVRLAQVGVFEVGAKALGGDPLCTWSLFLSKISKKI